MVFSGVARTGKSSNSFTNPNAIGIIRWLFQKSDPLPGLVFMFISRTNSTSARYLPLFEYTSNTRIVVLYGLRIPKTDRFLLLLFWAIKKLTKFRRDRYAWCHETSVKSKFGISNEILHVDDPTYSNSELEALKEWQKRLDKNNRRGIVVCTNKFTKNWIEKELSLAEVTIVEQGYLPIPNAKEKFPEFSCVYSSPYIHYGGDPHGNHTTWGAGLLFDEIIEPLSQSNPEVKFHLIGHLGSEAKNRAQKLRNIVSHGFVSQKQNQIIISKCHVGLYPRKHDHMRSIKKTYDFIGAGLPVVTYDLVDTSVIKELNLGITVKTEEDFRKAIVFLRTNEYKYQQYTKRILSFSHKFAWPTLSNKLEQLYGA